MSLRDKIDWLREPILQRDFTKEERMKLASQGKALRDGSYPIPDADALESAAHLAKSGHGNVSAAKKLIAKRARELGVANPLVTQMEDEETDLSVLQEDVTESVTDKVLQQLPSLFPPMYDGQMHMTTPDGEKRYIGYHLNPPVQQDAFQSFGAPSDAPAQVGVVNPQIVPAKKKRRVQQEEAQTPILQVDTMKRVVTYVLQTPDQATTPATMPEYELYYPRDTVQQMAWDFMKNLRNGWVGIGHNEVQQGQIVDPKGENAIIVENYIAPMDMHYTNGRVVKQGSWVQSAQIIKDEAWEAVLRGEINASSLASTSVDFEEMNEE